MGLTINTSYIAPSIFKVKLTPGFVLDDDQLYEFCRVNAELRIERTSAGELLIMPPAGSETGMRNAGLTYQLEAWSRKNGSGVAFDSSTGFTLPDGSMLSPDASWIERSRWEALPAEKRRKFSPLCPDFVIELLSPSDNLSVTQEKMEVYLANGARLGWLIDPEPKQVLVYRPGVPVDRLDQPPSISAEPELPGFVLDLTDIWK